MVGWNAGWFLAWQSYLLDAFHAEAGPSVTVFADTKGDLRNLWVGTGLGLFFGGLGVFFLRHGSLFAAAVDPATRRWSVVWRISGTLTLAIGLAAAPLLVSGRSLVIDESRGLIAMEQRWLYAATSEELPFDDLAQINLRVFRTLVGSVGRACQVGTGLSLVRNSRGWLEVPSGFGHEAVATRVAEGLLARGGGTAAGVGGPGGGEPQLPSSESESEQA